MIKQQLYTYDENDYLVQKNMDSNNFSVKIRKIKGNYQTGWENLAAMLPFKRAEQLFKQTLEIYKGRKKAYNGGKITYAIAMFLDDNKIKEAEV